MAIHRVLSQVTERIRRRSEATRSRYLGELDRMRGRGPVRHGLSCTNLAHGFAGGALRRAIAISAQGAEYTPIGRVVDERAVVNGSVGLLATGGSTNHTIHLVAMAYAAGTL
jgi:hypothetical protein